MLSRYFDNGRNFFGSRGGKQRCRCSGVTPTPIGQPRSHRFGIIAKSFWTQQIA